MGKRIRKVLYWLANNDGINGILSLLVFLIILVTVKISQKDVDLFDYTIFFAIFVTIILEVVTNFFSRLIKRKMEDCVKLDTNYEKVAKQYTKNLIQYNNSNSSWENQRAVHAKNKKNTNKYVFPVTEEIELTGKEIVIIDCEQQYRLPEEVQEHFGELFSAHSASNI